MSREDKGFVMLPYSIAHDPEFDNTSMRVLVAVIGYMRDRDKTDSTNGQLAAVTGFKPDTVKRALADLEHRGILRREMHADGRGRDLVLLIDRKGGVGRGDEHPGGRDVHPPGGDSHPGGEGSRSPEGGMVVPGGRDGDPPSVDGREIKKIEDPPTPQIAAEPSDLDRVLDHCQKYKIKFTVGDRVPFWLGLGWSADVLIRAIDHAVDSAEGPVRANFIEKILERWQKDGVPPAPKPPAKREIKYHVVPPYSKFYVPPANGNAEGAA